MSDNQTRPDDLPHDFDIPAEWKQPPVAAVTSSHERKRRSFVVWATVAAIAAAVIAWAVWPKEVFIVDAFGAEAAGSIELLEARKKAEHEAVMSGNIEQLHGPAAAHLDEIFHIVRLSPGTAIHKLRKLDSFYWEIEVISGPHSGKVLIVSFTDIRTK